MTPDSTRAMQDALQAAVAQMNNGGSASASGGGSVDTFGMLAGLLPMLFKNRNEDEQEDLLEKVEALRTDDIAALRSEIRTLNKQLHRLSRLCEASLGAFERQLVGLHGQVRTLARHMARVEIIPEGDELDQPPQDTPAEREPGPQRSRPRPPKPSMQP